MPLKTLNLALRISTTPSTLVLALNLKKPRFFRHSQIVHHGKEKSVKSMKIKVLKAPIAGFVLEKLILSCDQ